VVPVSHYGPLFPIRALLKLAPWFILAVAIFGYLDDHGAFLKADQPMPGSGARMGTGAIYATARRAGFTPERAAIATAIAMAESGGQPRAHNPRPPDNSYGLMQINMHGDLGPERRARYHLRRNADLYDPLTCMRVAWRLSAHGTDWSPWATYTHGNYRKFLAAARSAAQKG
jgi:hypothetical protein